MFEREFFRKTLGILFAVSFDTREEKVDSLSYLYWIVQWDATTQVLNWSALFFRKSPGNDFYSASLIFI